MNNQEQTPKLNAIDDPNEWTIRATREGLPFYECISAGIVTWARPAALHPLSIIGSAPEVYSFSSTLNNDRNSISNTNTIDNKISQLLRKL